MAVANRDVAIEAFNVLCRALARDPRFSSQQWEGQRPWLPGSLIRTASARFFADTVKTLQVEVGKQTWALEPDHVV
jgi:hypothetical protein